MARPCPLDQASAAGRLTMLRGRARADMGNNQSQRRRRHAVDAAGLADGPRPACGELLPRLVGKARHRRIVDARPATRSCRRGGTTATSAACAAEIDRVFRRRFRLVRRSSAASSTELRPDPRELRDADIRIRQQLEGRAPLAVRCERQAMAFGLVRRERAPSRASPSPLPAPPSSRRWRRARSAPTQPSAMPLSVSRWSALSARSVSRYSAREVNIR